MSSPQIGITVAITGNVLISLALNLQKLAHKRVEAEKVERRQSTPASTNGTPQNAISEAEEYSEPENGNEPLENVPLAPAAVLRVVNYGSTGGPGSSTNVSEHEMSVPPKKTLLANLFRSKRRREANGIASERTSLIPVDVITAGQVNGLQRPKRKPEDEPEGPDDWNESDYLKSKLWYVASVHPCTFLYTRKYRWLGFALMNLGECGNFISYAWAPASVVAPLGTVSPFLANANQSDSSSLRSWRTASSPRSCSGSGFESATFWA